MPNYYNTIRAKKFSTSADTALEIAPYNSATPNFAIDAGGKLKWGSGSATADANLYRTSASTLKTDGSLEIVGDLTVTGTTTTINSTTLTVDDKNIELGSVTFPTDSTADGGGITLKGATDKTFNWVDATDAWTSSENLNLVSGKTLKIDNTDVLTPSAILGSSTSASIGASTGTTTVNNTLVVQQIREKMNDNTVSTNVMTCDFSTGAIFYNTTTLSANFTVNATNVPTDNGYAISITVIVNQGGTGYYPSALQIAGASQTIKWSNGNTVPTPTPNKIDLFTFTLLRRGSTWTILGSYSLNF